MASFFDADNNIMDQVREISPALPPPQTKAEIIEYYQETYGDRWRVRLVGDLAPIAGIKEKNLRRRFDPDRINNVPRRKSEQQEYKTLGDQLPPRYEYPSGYEVTFKGQIRISKKCYFRAFTITIGSTEGVKDFTENPSILTILDIYFEGDNIAEGLCDDPEIVITAF